MNISKRALLEKKNSGFFVHHLHNFLYSIHASIIPLQVLHISSTLFNTKGVKKTSKHGNTKLRISLPSRKLFFISLHYVLQYDSIKCWSRYNNIPSFLNNNNFKLQVTTTRKNLVNVMKFFKKPKNGTFTLAKAALDVTKFSFFSYWMTININMNV